MAGSGTETDKRNTPTPSPCGLGKYLRLSACSLVPAHRNSSNVKTITKHCPQHIVKMKLKYKLLGLVFKIFINMALALAVTIPFIPHTSQQSRMIVQMTVLGGGVQSKLSHLAAGTALPQGPSSDTGDLPTPMCSWHLRVIILSVWHQKNSAAASLGHLLWSELNFSSLNCCFHYFAMPT